MDKSLKLALTNVMLTDGRGGGAERHEWLPRLFQGLYVWCHAWSARVDTCLVQLACGLGLVFSMLCRSNIIGVQLESRHVALSRMLCKLGCVSEQSIHKAPHVTAPSS